MLCWLCLALKPASFWQKKYTRIYLYPRSRSKINVQRIMEELGGGGHFNLAAAQIEDMSLSEAGEKLTQLILEELKERRKKNESNLF